MQAELDNFAYYFSWFHEYSKRISQFSCTVMPGWFGNYAKCQINGNFKNVINLYTHMPKINK